MIAYLRVENPFKKINTFTASYEYSRSKRIYHHQFSCNYLKNQKSFVNFLLLVWNLH